MKPPRQNSSAEGKKKHSAPPAEKQDWKAFLRAKGALTGRILLHAAGILVVVLGLALIFRDYIAKITFPAVASWYLGVDVVFDDISTTVDGKVTVYNLRVMNPDGYSIKNMLEADEVVMDVKLASLFKKELVLEKVIAENIRITPELNAAGKFNFSELNDKVLDSLTDENMADDTSLRINYLKCNGRITLLISAVKVPLYHEFDFEQNDLVIGGGHESFIEKFALQNHIARTMLPPLFSWVLGVETTIGDVDLSLNGAITLYDVRVANLPGFQHQELLRIKRLYLAADPSKFSDKRTVIRELTISGSEVAAEFDSREQFNLQLFANQLLQRFPPGSGFGCPGEVIVEHFACDTRLWIKTPKVSMMQTQIKVGPRRVVFEDDGTTMLESFARYSGAMAEKLRVFTPGDVLKLAAEQFGDVLTKAIELPMFWKKKPAAR